MNITISTYPARRSPYTYAWIPEKTCLTAVDEETGIEITHRYFNDHGDKSVIGRSGVIYVDGEESVSEEGLEHTIRGEDPEMDKAWDKLNRQVVKNKRAVIAELVNSPSFDQLPENVQNALTGKLSFSRYAGCSCPCSPGFRTKEWIGIGGAIWITKS